MELWRLYVRFPNKYIKERFNFTKETPAQELYDKLDEIWEELKEEEYVMPDHIDDWSFSEEIPEDGNYSKRAYFLIIDIVDKEIKDLTIIDLRKYARHKNIDLKIRVEHYPE